MVTEGSYQSFFLIAEKGVIVVDCPPTLGIRVKYAIGNLTDAPIKTLVYSHAHADHIQGAFLLAGDGVDIVAHEETANLLEHLNDNARRPAPTKTFRDTEKVKVGNQTLELAYKGDNHVAGNIFMYAPAQKVLMLVDVIFPGWAPFTQLGAASSVPGYIKAHELALEYDFDHFLGGHLSRPGTRQDVLANQQYVAELRDACQAVLEDVPRSFGPIGAAFQTNPGNGWAIGEAIIDSASTACADRVTPNWLGRISGADVFAFENAYRMVSSLRIDYGFLGAGTVVTQ